MLFEFELYKLHQYLVKNRLVWMCIISISLPLLSWHYGQTISMSKNLLLQASRLQNNFTDCRDCFELHHRCEINRGYCLWITRLIILWCQSIWVFSFGSPFWCIQIIFDGGYKYVLIVVFRSHFSDVVIFVVLVNVLDHYIFNNQWFEVTSIIKQNMISSIIAEVKFTLSKKS